MADEKKPFIVEFDTGESIEFDKEPTQKEKGRMMSEFLLSIKIDPLEEGGYLATSDDLPELLAQGRTVAETLEIAQDVARKIVESYLDHGDPLPDVLKTVIPAGVSLEAKIPVSVAA